MAKHLEKSAARIASKAHAALVRANSTASKRNERRNRMLNEGQIVIDSPNATVTVIGIEKWTPERTQSVFARYAHKIGLGKEKEDAA